MLGKVEDGRRRGDSGRDGWMASPISGHESEQTLGDSERQGSPAGCGPWGHKELDRAETEQQQQALWQPDIFHLQWHSPEGFQNKSPLIRGPRRTSWPKSVFTL